MGLRSVGVIPRAKRSIIDSPREPKNLKQPVRDALHGARPHLSALSA